MGCMGKIVEWLNIHLSYLRDRNVPGSISDTTDLLTIQRVKSNKYKIYYLYAERSRIFIFYVNMKI